MKKRVLAIAMILAMALSLLPTVALAVGTPAGGLNVTAAAKDLAEEGKVSLAIAGAEVGQSVYYHVVTGEAPPAKNVGDEVDVSEWTAYSEDTDVEATDGSYIEAVAGTLADTTLTVAQWGVTEQAIEDGYETTPTVFNSADQEIPKSESIFSGKCGEDVVWELNETTGVLTISGTGEMYNYKYHNSYGGYTDAPWWGGQLTYWNRTIKKIIVSDGVTNIGDYAFYRCSSLTDVQLGNDIKTIGIRAFYDCDSIKEIELPDELTTIEDGAFGSCDGMQNIFIPQNVSYIGESSIGIMLGNNIKAINVSEENKFYSSIDGMLFNDDATKLLRCPEGKVGIVNIPIGTTCVAENAFWGCQMISVINIPSTVDEIEGIGVYFDGFAIYCYQLSQINASAENETYFSIDGVLFSKIEQSMVAYPAGKKDFQIYSIPNNITKIESKAFSNNDSLLGIVIPSTIDCIEENAFIGCEYLTDIYFAADEETWDYIFKGEDDEIEGITIHYNSTGPDDVGDTDDSDEDEQNIDYLIDTFVSYDSNTGEAVFGNTATVYSYQVTEETDLSFSGNLESILGKNVAVRYRSGEYGAPDMLTRYILSIEPVEAYTGAVSAVGADSLAVNGTTYQVNEKITSDLPYINTGNYVLIFLYQGTVGKITPLQTLGGTLQAWDAATGEAIIDGVTYSTNYLSQIPDYMSQLVGRDITVRFDNTNEDAPVLISVSFRAGFHFVTNAVTNSLEEGQSFEFYVNYYGEDGSTDSTLEEFISVVSNSSIISLSPSGWNEQYGQHYTVLAKEPGTVDITITNPQNGDAVVMELTVVEKQTGYNFDNVPELTYEEGRTTNFYNHNGMVVDNFSYRPHIGANGAVIDYNVTMTVYNSLNLYGTVTSFTADGEIADIAIIDKMTEMPSNFSETMLDLYTEVGDLFYLLDNEFYYSGASISQKTDISITVPAGGYLEISNSSSSGTVAMVNVAGLIIDGAFAAKDLVSSTIEVSDLKPIILQNIFGKDYILDKVSDIFLKTAADQFKYPEWDDENCGDIMRAFIFQLEDYGIDLMHELTEEIVSLTGAQAITESILLEFIPTGNLINFLYDLFGAAEQQVAWATFRMSMDFADGIYIYAPSVNNEYLSNGIRVTPSTTTNPEVVVHAYLVVDSEEVNITENTLPNEETYQNGTYETYNITMYENGQEAQPDGEVTVRIPLSDMFSQYDSSKIKVYRLNDDGTVTDMYAEIEDGYAIFRTDHFSYYIVAYEGDVTTIPTPDPDPAPDPPPDVDDDDGDSSSSDTDSDSDSAPNYTISVSAGQGGDVTLSTHRGSAGARITVTVEADTGYELDSLTVTDRSGNELTLTQRSDSTYTFHMPDGPVTVEASFVRLQTEEETPSASAAPVFADVARSAWYYDAVTYAAQRGLMTGMSTGRFAPNDTLTRAQLVQILYALEGRPAVSSASASAFTDVNSGAWYASAVNWAAASGVASGVGGGAFGPNDPLTREQLALILYRYAQNQGYDTTQGGMAVREFADYGSISSWASQAVTWAVNAGLLSGTGSGMLSPAGTATRAQVAQILMNFCQKNNI